MLLLSSINLQSAVNSYTALRTGRSARSTRTLSFCGTRILPVLEDSALRSVKPVFTFARCPMPHARYYGLLLCF
jgi:hypothetical protein